MPTKTSPCERIKFFHEIDFASALEKCRGDGGRCPPSDRIDDGAAQVELLQRERAQLQHVTVEAMSSCQSLQKGRGYPVRERDAGELRNTTVQLSQFYGLIE